MRKNFTDLSTTIASWIPKLSLLSLLVSCSSVPDIVQNAEIIEDPKVDKDDKVTLRLDVKDANNKPVIDLDKNDFDVWVDKKRLLKSDFDLQKPGEGTAPDAWVIILLDFSGSMLRDDNKIGMTKLEGAVWAIGQFIQELDNRKGETKVSILPFGTSDDPKSCDVKALAVNDTTINNNFFSTGSFELTNHLNQLARKRPCARTNLYQPLLSAVDFFIQDPRFQSKETSPGLLSILNISKSEQDIAEDSSRVSIVLLSDGYHNDGSTNAKQAFNDLSFRLDANPHIKIHTLGYGISPEELGNKYLGGKSADLDDVCTIEVDKGITDDEFKASCPGKVPAEEFVDKKTLEKIAALNDGISEISPDANEISKTLQTVLDAIISSYTISYDEPNPIRLSSHRVVIENSINNSFIRFNASKQYRIIGFGRPVDRPKRITIFLATLLAIVLLGLVPFWQWSKKIKKDIQ